MNAIKTQTAGGQIVYIEISDDLVTTTSVVGGGTVAGGKKAIERINDLKDVGEKIAEVCRTLQDQIQSGLQKSKPSELTLEFGVKLAGEMGIPFVTKGSAEATFQVTAKWDFK